METLLRAALLLALEQEIAKVCAVAEHALTIRTLHAKHKTPVWSVIVPAVTAPATEPAHL